MWRASDFLPPLFAAALGAATAVLVHVSGLTDPVVLPTVITVDSEIPGVEFAIISDAFIDADVQFVTPATIRLQDESVGLIVVPMDPSSSVTFRTERVGSFSAFSPGERGYSLHTLGGGSVVARGAPRGELEGLLAESGLSFTGVQFGDGVTCAKPAVWNFAMEERFIEARQACLEGGR